MRASVRVNSVSRPRASGFMMVSTPATVLRSKPIPQLTTVVNATAISTPGSLGIFLRIRSMMAIAATPIASVGRWVSPTCVTTPQMSWMKCSERPMGTPISLLICDRAMISAAALVKPTITGWDRKFTTTPSLKTPRVSCTSPTSSASITASTTYCSVPGVANGASEDAVSSDTTATGPVPNWLDEPHSAATITGRNAAYRP